MQTKKWDIQLFLTDKPEAIFDEWCKQIPEHGFDTPYHKEQVKYKDLGIR